MIGVPVSRVMSSSREGISTPTSTILDGGVPPPLVGAPRLSTSTAPLSPSSRVVQPPAPSDVVDMSSGVVTSITRAHFASPYFMETTQSSPSGSFLFI